MKTTANVETPSGKGAGDENFPVGSWLLPARLRPHIATFYAFARAIDDIADNPELDAADKIARLDGFANAVTGQGTQEPAYRKAQDIRASLAETQVSNRHCTDLVAAFKQDAVKSRYDGWDDLMAYCDLSAAPVGRYLVDLHDEPDTAYAASDALCNALQVLNHLQDCQDDYTDLGRIYLPGNWMADADVTVDALSSPRASAGLRHVLDRCLDGTQTLLRTADRLPGQLRDMRFAMEAAVILAIAWKLCATLRRRDPLAERVVLNKAQFAVCCLRGVLSVLFRRATGRGKGMRRQPSHAGQP